MTDLKSNLRAIELAKGNVEYAYNYLSDGLDEQTIIDPYM
jgi:hypothetical protein